MLYPFVLSLHICVALITGVVILFALYSMAQSRVLLYRRAAGLLAGVAALEVATGIVLAFVSPTITAMSLSAHMAIYLGICLAVETFLYIRMQEPSYV